MIIITIITMAIVPPFELSSTPVDFWVCPGITICSVPFLIVKFWFTLNSFGSFSPTYLDPCCRVTFEFSTSISSTFFEYVICDVLTRLTFDFELGPFAEIASDFLYIEENRLDSMEILDFWLFFSRSMIDQRCRLSYIGGYMCITISYMMK